MNIEDESETNVSRIPYEIYDPVNFFPLARGDIRLLARLTTPDVLHDIPPQG